MRTGEALRPLGANTSSLNHQNSYLKETERLWLQADTQNGAAVARKKTLPVRDGFKPVPVDLESKHSR